MSKTYSASLLGNDLKFGIVLSRWNDFMGQKLLSAAQDILIRHGVADENIEVALVPGSFELPLVAQKMAVSGRYDAIICLGVIIRGATPHFDYVANEASKGIAKIALDHQMPVSFGLITADNIEQAIERSGSKVGNKGTEAALAALEMANLLALL